MAALFEESGDHELYERLRDPSGWMATREDGTPAQRQQKLNAYFALRQRMEQAWTTFEACAERSFHDGLRRNFWPGWFELYLQSIVPEYGLENKATRGQGEPDFILHLDGQHCFDIEASMLTAGGDGGNSVAGLPWPETGKPIIQDVSDTIRYVDASGNLVEERNRYAQNDFCLRLTGAIKSKQDQIARWKISGSSDPTKIPIIVALSSADIDLEAGRIISDSEFERVLYGKGYLTIPIENNMLLGDRAFYERVTSMKNKNEAEIQLGLFHRSEYIDISAVAYFSDGLLDYGCHPPTVFLNPNASAPFSPDHLPVGTYKTFRQDKVCIARNYRE